MRGAQAPNSTHRFCGRGYFLNYWMFSVHAPFDAKKKLIAKHRGKVDPKDPQRRATYAAMVESMDDAVGTLLDAIDRLGIAEKTIVIFYSDNGGNMYDRVDNTSPTSNSPLRGGKATLYEGGIRVPCVFDWPGHVKPGTRSQEIIQTSDLFPTLLGMTGFTPKTQPVFDGIDISPALAGGKLGRKAIFTYFPHDPPVPDWLPPAMAVHEGDWKLIRIFFGGENGAHRYKLFNLRNDIGETKDLAASEPERVREMDALIEDFLKRTRAVMPVRNPAFKEAAYHPEEEGVGEMRQPAKPKKRRKK